MASPEQPNMAWRCAHCSSPVAVSADNRMPPWCPRCGGDLKAGGTIAEEGESDQASHAALPSLGSDQEAGARQLTWREPTANTPGLSTDNPAMDEPLPDTIERVRRRQQARQQERWRNRRAGLGAFLGGLAFLAVGVFVLWFNTWWEGRLVVPARLLLVLLLPLAVSLAGLYGFLTGEKTLDFSRELAWDISIGAEGIRRVPAASTAGLIDGKVIRWHAIAYLEYQEDFAFGTGRFLLIHLTDGGRDRIGIAAEVTARQLAEAVAARGKRLQVATAGEWH